MAARSTTTETGAKNAPFIARQGLTFTIEATARTRAGAIVDLTGRTGSGQLRLNIGDAVSSATFTVTLTSATQGLAEAELGADTTAALAPGLYVGDLEFSLSPSDIIGTALFYVRVVQEVTR